MVNLTARTLHLVLSAIKNLREIKGSTSREILNYITSVYGIPPDVARRQMQTALKRAVSYGILKKNGAHYALPTNTNTALTEVAAQELGLLDFCVRRRKRARASRRLRGGRKVSYASRKMRGSRVKTRGSKKKRRRRRRASSRIGKKVTARLSKCVSSDKSSHVRLTRRGSKKEAVGESRRDLRRRKYADTEPLIEATRSFSDEVYNSASRRSRRSLQRKISGPAY